MEFMGYPGKYWDSSAILACRSYLQVQRSPEVILLGLEIFKNNNSEDSPVEDNKDTTADEQY